MRRASAIVVAVLAVVAVWSLTGRTPVGEEATDLRRRGALAEEASLSGASRSRGTTEPRPGFPSMSAPSEDRSWNAMVWRELREPAQQFAGPGWTAEEKEQLLATLTTLRDAERRRERFSSDPDGSRSVEAAQRQRAAAVAADALSREMFGMPLGEFLLRAEPGSIEEVPTG